MYANCFLGPEKIITTTYESQLFICISESPFFRRGECLENFCRPTANYTSQGHAVATLSGPQLLRTEP